MFVFFGALILVAPLSGESAILPPAPISGSGTAALEIAAPTEPDDYRMGAYRAPTPATLAGAAVVSSEQARQLWTEKAAVFIDVLPRPPKPENLPDDVIWRVPPRHNIPDSVWLPNVGYGRLNTEVEAYFRDNLSRLTDGDTAAAILFYCLTDCWMSWNAAKRALSYGYSKVYWYPEGTEGWSAVGGSLEESTPLPMDP